MQNQAAMNDARELLCTLPYPSLFWPFIASQEHLIIYTKMQLHVDNVRKVT